MRIKQKFYNLKSDQRFLEILTGSVWAFSASAVQSVLGLLISVFIARVYGAKVIGVVAVMNSFFLLVTIFTVFGTNISLLRLIPEHMVKYSPTSAFNVYRKTQWMVIAVSLFMSFLFFWGADLIADKIFSKPHFSFYFSLSSLFVIFKSLQTLNIGAVRGLRLTKAFAFLQVLPQCINLAILAGFGFLLKSPDVPIYALLGGITAPGILGCIIVNYTFRKKQKQNDRVQSMTIPRVLSISFPMFMTSSMTFIIGETGVIMLGLFRSDVEVGHYSIVVKLATLTTFILNAVNAMAGPKFSELYHSKKMDELFYVAKKSTKLIFWTTIPILLGNVILGKQLLYIIYGQEFTIAYPALVFLVIGQFVNSISGATGLFMNMTGKQKIFRNIVSIAAVSNIAINFLLIPQYGIYGAAFAAAICIMGWNIATLCYMKHKFGKITAYFPMIT